MGTFGCDARVLDATRFCPRGSGHDSLEEHSEYSNEELFTKKYFNWTGTTDLGSYFVSTTSSHYDWAIKKIKSHCKKVK